MVFEVIVALKLGVASSHRVCSFQQVVAKESVTGFNHAGVLGFKIARLMLCPHKAGILGNGSLRLETVDVADLGDDTSRVQIVHGRLGKRVYDSAGIACTQDTSRQSGLYFVDLTKGDPKITANARCLHTRQDGSLTNFKGQNSGVLYIKEATKKGYKEAHEGDSIDLGFAGSNTRRGRVGKNVAHTLQTSCIQGIVARSGRVRRLMPRECFRLQGFSEDQIDKILAINSDAQAYKQAGNSVTVPVIEAIGRRIRAADAELYAQESR